MTSWPQTGGTCMSCAHYDSCRGGCMAAKFFTGLPLDGPDPECVLGHGEALLAKRGDAPVPKPSIDMSRKRRPSGKTAGLRVIQPPRALPCDPSPIAGLVDR